MSIVTQNKENGNRVLMCTGCGGDVVVTLRHRHPHGWQPYAECLACGARNWVDDQDEPWALIRYVPQTQEEVRGGSDIHN